MAPNGRPAQHAAAGPRRASRRWRHRSRTFNAWRRHAVQAATGRAPAACRRGARGAPVGRPEHHRAAGGRAEPAGHGREARAVLAGPLGPLEPDAVHLVRVAHKVGRLRRQPQSRSPAAGQRRRCEARPCSVLRAPSRVLPLARPGSHRRHWPEAGLARIRGKSNAGQRRGGCRSAERARGATGAPTCDYSIWACLTLNGHAAVRSPGVRACAARPRAASPGHRARRRACRRAVPMRRAAHAGAPPHGAGSSQRCRPPPPGCRPAAPGSASP